jgi:hypothetical protein
MMNGSVEQDAAGNVVVGAPVAQGGARAPLPYGGDSPPAGEVAVANLGVDAAPRVLVGLLLDGTPVLYERRAD